MQRQGTWKHLVPYGVRLDYEQTLIKFHFSDNETMKNFTAFAF